MMKLFKKLSFVVLFVFITFSLALSSVHADSALTVHFFYNATCSDCHDERLKLDEIKDKYHLNIIEYEVTLDDENATLFNEIRIIFGDGDVLTPYLVIGGIALPGYDVNQFEHDIEDIADYYSANEMHDIVSMYQNSEEILPEYIVSIESIRTGYEVPFLGEVLNPSGLVMLLATVILGIFDGYNPCAMWVLLYLIGLLIKEKNRKKMWLLGSAFLLTSAVMYFLIMASLLNITVEVMPITWVRKLLGYVTLALGTFQIIRYFRKKKKQEVGCDVTTESSKRSLLDRLKKTVQQKNIWIALVGIITLAITVNFVELLCSAFVPATFVALLGSSNYSMLINYLFILIYVLFFLIDDVIIFVIAMVTLQAKGISNRLSKVSTLVGGIIMLIIGVYLIFIL